MRAWSSRAITSWRPRPPSTTGASPSPNTSSSRRTTPTGASCGSTTPTGSRASSSGGRWPSTTGSTPMTPTIPDLPPLTTLGVPQILLRRDCLAEALRTAFLDDVIEDLGTLVDVAAEHLPRNTHRESLEESLRSLHGERLTEARVKEVSHRLAGNVHRLRACRPAYRWLAQRVHEWVPVQVTQAQPDRDRWGHLGMTLTFKYQGGTPCPLVIDQWWGYPKLRYLAESFGFSRPTSVNAAYPAPYPFEHGAQYVCLRAYVLVDPALSLRQPDFREVKVPAESKRWNREQLKHTFRVDEGYTCPEDYPQTFPCHHCWRGYQSCRAGKHPLNYTFGPCEGCQRDEAAFDPAAPSKLCVDCTRRERLRRKDDDHG